MRVRFLVLLSLLCPATMRAQEMYKDVEYITGRTGMDDKVKGTMIISATGIALMTSDGTVILRIPLSGVTQVSSETDIRDASVGKKLLWGGFAGSRKQEFVNVTSETDSSAEAVVFKVKQGTSVGIVAKIKFAMKQLAASGAAPETHATGTPAASVDSGKPPQ